MNSLLELAEHGQSYWLDNLTRAMIKNGELKKRVEEQDLRGITSNPSTFSKAISGSDLYDDDIRSLVKERRSVREIYEALTVSDVQAACDILRPVYDRTDGQDGFVSLEVSPYLAHDAEGTMAEARRLFAAVDRPNCFIKIPGTEAGVPAIEQMLYEGINVNVTLLFSIEAYEAVAHAYISALTRRSNEGKSIDNIASVASFFLSRIDVLTDQLLNHQMVPESSDESSPRPEQLLGKAAIASAKLAYQSFKEIFSGKQWEQLAEQGARVQRPLWASTSTKDPLYSDVKYVEPLIGSDTVNTLPERTIAAFADHGTLRNNTIEENLDVARGVFDDLDKVGVNIGFVTTQLVNEGVQKFIDPFDHLMEVLAKRRKEVLKDELNYELLSYGEYEPEVHDVLSALDARQYVRRMFAKDGTLWKSDPESVQHIENRLGWLDSVGDFQSNVEELTDFAEKIRSEGYEHVVLLGMGGSSLSSEVARRTFGSREGYPDFLMLDNTDPEAVKAIEDQVNYAKTLFIVGSKSGTTTETLSFYKYYFAQVTEAVGENAGANFVAITDPGSHLADEAKEHNFRRTFINPPDIGGRYSVLSWFGLVPIALMGIDVKALLDSAYQMLQSCRPFIPSRENPAVHLGAMLGTNHQHQRDKVTFFFSDSLEYFGFWLEQLLAESTGKEGRGLVPVVGEELKRFDAYNPDRQFVYIYLRGENDKSTERRLQSLEKAGFPVARIEVEQKTDLGAEFFRWEMATGTAGKVIGIDPFNEPNVAESKQNTKELLSQWKEQGEFTIGEPLVQEDDITVYAREDVDWLFSGHRNSLNSFIRAFFDLVEPWDYVAILSYFHETDDRNVLLNEIRQGLRNHSKAATTQGYGPRYLHSTGQIHKGGANTGVFVILTAEAQEKLMIPGEDFDFGTLHTAKALGDFRSLNDKNRRVIRIHLGDDIQTGLMRLKSIVE